MMHTENKRIEHSRIYFSSYGKRCKNRYPLGGRGRQEYIDREFTDRTENITVRNKLLPYSIEFKDDNYIALKIHVRYTNGNPKLRSLFREVHGEFKTEEEKKKLRRQTRKTFRNAFKKDRKSPVAVLFTWGRNRETVETAITNIVLKKITKLMLHHPKFQGKSPVFFARCSTCRKIFHIKDV